MFPPPHGFKRPERRSNFRVPRLLILLHCETGQVHSPSHIEVRPSHAHNASPRRIHHQPRRSPSDQVQTPPHQNCVKRGRNFLRPAPNRVPYRPQSSTRQPPCRQRGGRAVAPFAWKHPSGLRPLSKKEVTKRIEAITKTQDDLPDLKGHSLRIGGTLFYLLKGVPFDVVKTLGRWSSESFTLYLRHHALVLAPFLQHRPDILENLRRYILPPVR